MKYIKFLIISVIGIFFIIPYNIAEAKAAETEGNIELFNNADSSVIISDPMTAEELITEYMENENVDYDVARVALFPNNEDKLFEGRTVLSQKKYSGITPFVNRYRTLSKNVSPHGSVYFYCATSEAPPSFRGIVQVLNAGYNTGSKVYSGTLYYNLVNANRIDFILNGHLYNVGTLGMSGGGSIGIGQSATLNFNLSYSSNYFNPVHVNSRVTF